MLTKLFFTKKTLFHIVLLSIYGCTVPINARKDACPRQPIIALEESDIEEITLENGVVERSGQINFGQQKGYVLIGNPGQKLSYRTTDDICVWVYSPDSKLMKSNKIEKKGKYTLQIASLQGATSYALEVTFGEFKNSDTTSNAENSSTLDSKTPTIKPSLKTSSDGATLNQSDAKSLVEKWLNAKSDIFAPPFNRELVTQLTTGTLYRDITKRNGPLDWLRENNSYYVYRKSFLEKVWSFDNSNSQPSLKVSIFEDYTFYNGNLNKSKSSAKTEIFTYFFSMKDGLWKIADYR